MKRICIDFDDTIFNRETGTVFDGAKNRINSWYENNHITIFTNRPDYEYRTVAALLEAWGIQYHRIICGKPSYDMFIDDKAITFESWHVL